MSALPLSGIKIPGSDAGARGPVVGADAGGSRRRGDQDRAPRRRRRRPRLWSALPGRSRRQGRTTTTRSICAPTATRNRSPSISPSPKGRTIVRELAKIRRRDDGELQGRRSQALRARLRDHQEDQPRHHLLLGDRFRPDRTLRAARRLRRDPAGDGRADERHRPHRRRARRGPDEGRPLDRRLHDRHEHLDRHSLGAAITARPTAGKGSISTSACSTP